MKALTLHQPWATLVAIGAKTIETRGWPTNYRGLLAIHAAKTIPDYAKDAYFTVPQISDAIHAAGYALAGLPLGAVVCTCELIGCHQVDRYDWIPGKRGWSKGRYFWEASEQEKAFGNYEIGRYMWFIANIKPLEKPIPARGMQGLWEWAEPE